MKKITAVFTATLLATTLMAATDVGFTASEYDARYGGHIYMPPPSGAVVTGTNGAYVCIPEGNGAPVVTFIDVASDIAGFPGTNGAPGVLHFYVPTNSPALFLAVPGATGMRTNWHISNVTNTWGGPPSTNSPILVSADNGKAMTVCYTHYLGTTVYTNMTIWPLIAGSAQSNVLTTLAAGDELFTLHRIATVTVLSNGIVNVSALTRDYPEGVVVGSKGYPMVVELRGTLAASNSLNNITVRYVK